MTNAAGATVRSHVGRAGGSVTCAWKRDRRRRPPRAPTAATRSRSRSWDAAGNAAARTAIDRPSTRRRPAITPRATPRRCSRRTATASGHDAPGLDGARARRRGSVRCIKGSTPDPRLDRRRRAAWAATWNGTRADGSRVGDGPYTLRVGAQRRRRQPARDRQHAGRRRPDRRRPRAGRGTSSRRTATRSVPTSTLAWRLTRDATTTLRVYDAAGRARPDRVDAAARRAPGTRAGRGTGAATTGARAAGPLSRAAHGVSPLGTSSTSERGVGGRVRRSRRSATSVKAGPDARVRFRSVEPLSTKPRVTFRQPGRDGRHGDRAPGSTTAS